MSGPSPCNPVGGGRTWWAHFEFVRINIEAIILRKKIEDLHEAGALTSIASCGQIITKRRRAERAGAVPPTAGQLSRNVLK
jgi:hypothetical protein